MTSEISLPLWVFLALVAVALLATIDRLLIPSVRWFLRRRVNRAIEEVNTRLKISIRPFQLTKRQVLIDRLVYDAKVIEAMQGYAEKKGMPREIAQSRVVEYAKEIVPAFNAYVYFRVGYWLSKLIAQHIYAVRVGFEDERRLGAVDPEATVVFVMNHRSNMDYILVSYLVAEESTLSYAVGEWARVWPLRMLIRAMGAFFVRRNSGNDLYRKVLERYVSMATEEGVCQAVFLEGGLSHDGKLRDPKLGFLDYMVRNFDADRHRDIVFVPAGLNYDRVLEDRSLLRRRDPDSPRRSKWFVLRTAVRFYRKNIALPKKERRKRFGYSGVNFGKPISLKEFTRERGLSLHRLGKAERFEEVALLADHLMSAVARVIPILPVGLVASVFHRAGDNELTSYEVVAGVHEVISEIQARGAPIRDSERPKEVTIARALELLVGRGIVLRKDDGSLVCGEGSEAILLFYCNSIAHWYGAEENSGAFRSIR